MTGKFIRLLLVIGSVLALAYALVGWKTPLWGCIGFFAVAVGFLLFFGGGYDTISFTMITGIPLVLAIIYAVVWFASRKNMKEL